MSGWFRRFIKNYAEKTVYLTDCLGGKNKIWNWTIELDKEFENMKETLRGLGKLKIVNYEKELLLRTGTSSRSDQNCARVLME